ncbi:MAG TPA: DUF1684 domain-containing protein [Bacteroidota bacterium]|nr:DUF1684 domain-containing protein [Bacteroidota bacterium]
MKSAFLSILLFVLVLMGCTKQIPFDAAAHKKEIEEWQKTRDTRLRGDQGWLTLCGLFWLKEGENKMGTDTTGVVVFPKDKAPAYAGSLWLENGNVRLEAPKNSEITLKDSTVTSMKMESDKDSGVDPTILSLRTLTFQIIYRNGQIGVRVKDRKNPLRLNFTGMEYFPIDPKWRFDAKFEPYNPPKILPIATMIGTTDKDTCPGAIVFTVDGKEMRLEPVMEQGTTDQFFIMYSDETSGKETYGMGRQLYSSLPDSNNHLVIDFNKGYNWPCVFTEYATCPIPPRQNHLPLRVEAGEKMFHGHE